MVSEEFSEKVNVAILLWICVNLDNVKYGGDCVTLQWGQTFYKKLKVYMKCIIF